MFPAGALRQIHPFQENAQNVHSAKKIMHPSRRPFKDLAVNATPQKDVQTKSKTKKVPFLAKEPEIFVDICSYKEVEDTMEDIWPKSERFNMDKLFRKETTPPFQYKPKEITCIPSPKVTFSMFEDQTVPLANVSEPSMDFMDNFYF